MCGPGVVPAGFVVAALAWHPDSRNKTDTVKHNALLGIVLILPRFEPIVVQNSPCGTAFTKQGFGACVPQNLLIFPPLGGGLLEWFLTAFRLSERRAFSGWAFTK